MDDWEFREEPFLEFVGASLQTLAEQLQSCEDWDAQLKVGGLLPTRAASCAALMGHGPVCAAVNWRWDGSMSVLLKRVLEALVTCALDGSACTVCRPSQDWQNSPCPCHSVWPSTVSLRLSQTGDACSGAHAVSQTLALQDGQALLLQQGNQQFL